jgi:hypothetical protein
LAAWRADPHHHSAVVVLALKDRTMSATHAEPTSALPRAGLSWAAVFGGAIVATAVTVMLLALGSGLGLAAGSPTGADNPSATTFTVYAAIWLIVVQWVASGFGGYLAGRLRPGLHGVHTDEVAFRDTASGFVAWAVATVFIVGLALSGGSSLLGGAGRMVASATGGAASAASRMSGGGAYNLDMLFRPAQPSASESNTDAKAEAGRILLTGARGDVSADDKAYLAKLVAARAGISADAANKRVEQAVATEKAAVAKALQAANAARKAALSLALYSFFSMLVGAFIACVAGAIGGRQRDAF